MSLIGRAHRSISHEMMLGRNIKYKKKLKIYIKVSIVRCDTGNCSDDDLASTF